MPIECPILESLPERITLAHGGGGRMQADLLRSVFLPAFGGDAASLHDAAILTGRQLAVTTDSFVVNPPFFRGGDIGLLSVYGTVNDLAMAGARPIALTCSFIIAEGFAIADLRRIVESMQRAADSCGVRIISGDTKVVEAGKADPLYITTSGVGEIDPRCSISPSRIAVGDSILVSGPIGAHGLAVMLTRAGLEFEHDIDSDTASLWPLVDRLAQFGADIHCLRDATRGGVAAVMNELAGASKTGAHVQEAEFVAAPAVRVAAELLGLDPLHVANEGVLVAYIASGRETAALESLRSIAPHARIVGQVTARPGVVTIESPYGTARVLDYPSGENLPRIC